MSFIMIDYISNQIRNEMQNVLNWPQIRKLNDALKRVLSNYTFNAETVSPEATDEELVSLFLSAKQVEGCSQKTLNYYENTITLAISTINKPATHICTDDLRGYLSEYKKSRQSSKITIDNIRRILSSFYSWLEDEDYVVKSPVRRIRKIKTGRTFKETFTDEHLELLRDSCASSRDRAIIEILSSTGMRVGEMVKLNIDDIDFQERECIVYGKGDSERKVYFDARTKIHLKNYLNCRTDHNPALFVSVKKPHNRLKIGGIESIVKQIGSKSKIENVHPHKFRRTLATRAIDRGMPIEQVQHLLGHVRIDTTMQYAMVNQSNVKISHRRYISG